MVELIMGDCLEEMRKLIDRGVKVDAVITDPPYGTTGCKWDFMIPIESMWSILKKISKPTTPIVLFCSEPFASILRISNRKMYKYDWCWLKNMVSNVLNAKRMPLRQYENIAVFYDEQCTYNPIFIPYSEKVIKRHGNNSKVKVSANKSKHYNVKCRSEHQIKTVRGRHPSNILLFDSVVNGNGKKLHPTQKPIGLLEYLVQTYTKPGETVLDFTMGSGTTGVACKRLRRNFIGIELDPKYFEIAKNRIDKTIYEPSLFEEEELEIMSETEKQRGLFD